MPAKTRFLNPVWREVAELALQEQTERVKELGASMRDHAEISRTLLSVSSFNGVRGSEDRIAERVTNSLTDLFMAGGATDRIAFIISDNTLRRWPSTATGMLLSPERRKLIESLSHEFTSPKTLAVRSGFKNAVGVQQAVAKIKRKFQATFGLPTPLIEGREGYGYRLAEAYSLIDTA